MADMLALWGESRAARIARIDFGAVPARSSSDVRFRVKNQSSQYTAQAVMISIDESPVGAETQLWLSLDGLNFAASVTVGDLPAAAISPVVTVRRATATDAPTGAQECAIRVHAAAWVSADTLS